jgi:outer membrane protein TolC
LVVEQFQTSAKCEELRAKASQTSTQQQEKRFFMTETASGLRRIQTIGISALCITLAGCAVTRPEPLTQQEVTSRVQLDKNMMYAGQEPVSRPITFSEAAARALKYNLDYRVKLMEATLASGQLDLSRWDMMPRVLVNAGYYGRNNDAGGSSFDILTGNPTLSNSSSQQRRHSLVGAEFSWNVLDFGVSYYRSKQLADQLLIAEERKRKVVQNILQDVRNAYWRALGAQRLVSQMDALTKRTQSALSRARQIEQQGLMPQPQVLAYQRALLDATTLLQSRRQDLELAKAELIALMNLPPNANFVLAEDPEVKLPGVPSDLGKLEDLALFQRPELREEDYRKRISAAEVKRQMLSILPNLSFDVGVNKDSNRFLFNNTWVDYGVKLSASLMKLATYPAQQRLGKAQAELDETRRMAQAMAVLTQVRVASLRYGLAVAELEQVEESARVDLRLLNYAKAATTTRVESELELIRNEARSLLSQYQRHVAYSNAQAAWARLYNSIGLDLVPTDLNGSVSALATAITRTNDTWMRTAFNVSTSDAGKITIPGVSVSVESADAGLKAAVEDGLKTSLARYKIPLVEDHGAWKIVAKLRMEPLTSGQQRANWEMVVLRPNGTVAGRSRYASDLPTQASDRVISSLTQSAVDVNAVALVDWLEDPMRNVAGITYAPLVER